LALLAAALAAVAVCGAGPAPSDREIERFLLEGRVISIEEIGIGVTRPRRVVLEWSDRSARAAFKTVDIAQRGKVVEFASGRRDVDFTDRFRYERAAYLLDRRLGLGMVPVAVIREIDDQQGALIEWVEGAVSEQTRRRERGDAPLELQRQQRLMHLFDALIANDDRNLANQLITEDGRLHLIDHSRSFRRTTKLPPVFANSLAGVTRPLLRELGSLELAGLVDVMDGTLTKVEIRAMLKRRDRILEKIAADREAVGDAAVFIDDQR